MPTFNAGGGQVGYMAPQATYEEREMVSIARSQKRIAWATFAVAVASLLASVAAVIVAAASACP